jgi:hypothetical protein
VSEKGKKKERLSHPQSRSQSTSPALGSAISEPYYLHQIQQTTRGLQSHGLVTCSVAARDTSPPRQFTQQGRVLLGAVLATRIALRTFSRFVALEFFNDQGCGDSVGNVSFQ